mgnify:CR=1 FL=1
MPSFSLCPNQSDVHPDGSWARKIALELEWSEFNANIIFIVSFIAMYIIYIVFHELSVKIFQPMFERLFKRMGFKPRTDEVNFNCKKGKMFSWHQ